MNQKLGSKDGKNHRRLFFLNKRHKQNLLTQELEEKKKQDSLQEQKKTQELTNMEKKENVINFPADENAHVISNQKKMEDISNDIALSPISQREKVSVTTETKSDCSAKLESNFKENRTCMPSIQSEEKKQSVLEKDKDYLEKQIIKILEQQIDENKYQLKKIDSEIYSIEKMVDPIHEEPEIKKIEKQIELLMEKIKELKRKIESLKKTFDLDFPVDEPDYYLIDLVEKYQNKRWNENELNKKLKQNEEVQTFVDQIIEVEKKYENIKNLVKQKKENLSIDNKQVEKITQDIISIEEMKNIINQMLSKQETLLEQIRRKVNESVHVTEKVTFITKSVNHSLLELFLLMNILKHNLSIKNNILAAVSAKVALDMILKMTTPITEKVIVKESDLTDYQKLITACLNDTNKLEKIMDENLDNITSIRYTFEHDYKECSYLDSYQDAIKQLNCLEDEIKKRKQNVISMKKETQYQLDKNNDKVKKYGSIMS